MSFEQIRRAMEGSVKAATGRLDFVITETPDDYPSLCRILDEALAFARMNELPLQKIEVDMARFPELGTAYWHVEVEQCRAPNILRLTFGSLIAQH